MKKSVEYNLVAKCLLPSAGRYPDSVAMVFEGKEFTYRDILKEVSRYVAMLKKLGVKRGEVVAFLMTNRPEFPFSYLAVASMGAIALPIDPSYKPNEVTFRIKDSGTVAVIGNEQPLQRVYAVKDTLSTVRHYILAGPESAGTPLPKDVVRVKDMKEGNGKVEPCDVLPDDTAHILYTSGTTGVPKGAMITHQNLYTNAEACVKNASYVHEDRVVCVLPLFHCFGLLQTLFGPFFVGATVLLVERFSAKAVLETIDKYKATVMQGVPTFYILMLNLPELKSYSIKSLRFCLSGGASTAVEILERWKQATGGVVLQDGYGLSEATALVCRTPKEFPRKPGSLGRPSYRTEVRIVDEEGKDVPQGTVGELVCRGPLVMKGYLNDPSRTAEAIRDGWLHSGDLVYADPDGDLFLVGRKKEIIFRGGANVYPREVEEVLYKNPKVAEAAVIGVPDELFGEKVKAFIVLRSGVTATEEETKEFCAKYLAKYKTPEYVEFISEMPKTTTGKIRKVALKEKNK